MRQCATICGLPTKGEIMSRYHWFALGVLWASVVLAAVAHERRQRKARAMVRHALVWMERGANPVMVGALNQTSKGCGSSKNMNVEMLKFVVCALATLHLGCASDVRVECVPIVCDAGTTTAPCIVDGDEVGECRTGTCYVLIGERYEPACKP